MSGDAGKVYFILYLAVVLELLIIIVERDEAEEHLLKKQKESMKIVESILSQLQSGSGTEGINTRPQDEITIPPPGIDIEAVLGADIKSWRKYIIEVGVTDVSNDLKQRENEEDGEYNDRLKKLVELSNVEEIEYEIFFCNSDDPDNAPWFPNDEEIIKEHDGFKEFQIGQTIDIPDGNYWEYLSKRVLHLDNDETYNSLPLDGSIIATDIIPNYPLDKIIFDGPSFVPEGVTEDSVFFYSPKESIKETLSGHAEIKKRAFVVNFQPPGNSGWYKLRFSSRTNRILGVRADVKPDMIDKHTKVNIGTVQLSVEALEKVKKQLQSTLDKFNLPEVEILIEMGDLEKFDQMLKDAKAAAYEEEDVAEIRGKIDLYGYIAKLLAPGQSVNFSQNRGAIEFNVRVITPTPQIAEPVVSTPVYIGCFDKLPPAFEFTISPFQGKGTNAIEAKVVELDGVTTVARVKCTPLDELKPDDVNPPTRGGRQEWSGIVDQELMPGKYKVQVTHKLMGKSKMEEFNLEIFETGLIAKNKQAIDIWMENTLLYGLPLKLNVLPTSGGKIKSNQFRINLTTDNNQQRPPFVGLSMGFDDALKLNASDNTVSLEITWIQPYTDKELALYPKSEYEIKQEAPSINTNSQSVQASGDEKRPRIKISNITIIAPTSGDDADTKATIQASISSSNIEITGYEFAEDPIIEKEGDTYTITCLLSGKMQRGEDMIFGSLTVNLTAIAVNAINGKIGEETKAIGVPINFEPEKKKKGRGKKRRR